MLIFNLRPLDFVCWCDKTFALIVDNKKLGGKIKTFKEVNKTKV